MILGSKSSKRMDAAGCMMCSSGPAVVAFVIDARIEDALGQEHEHPAAIL